MSKTFIVRTPGHVLDGQRISKWNGPRSWPRKPGIDTPRLVAPVDKKLEEVRAIVFANSTESARVITRRKSPSRAAARKPRPGDKGERRPQRERPVGQRSWVGESITKTDMRRARKRYALKNEGQRLGYRESINVATSMA